MIKYDICTDDFLTFIPFFSSSYLHTQETGFLLIQDDHKQAWSFVRSIQVSGEATSFFDTMNIPN